MVVFLGTAGHAHPRQSKQGQKPELQQLDQAHLSARSPPQTVHVVSCPTVTAELLGKSSYTHCIEKETESKGVCAPRCTAS